MYKCKTGNYGNESLCLCFCCCRGYVHMQDWSFWKHAFLLMFLLCCIGYAFMQDWSFWKWSFIFMFMLLHRVCKHLRLGIFQETFVFMFLFLYRVFTHVRLGIWAMILCVYVCVGVEGMYTYKTGHFGNNDFCLCLCCCIGYIHMYDLIFWYQMFVFMILLV